MKYAGGDGFRLAAKMLSAIAIYPESDVAGNSEQSDYEFDGDRECAAGFLQIDIR